MYSSNAFDGHPQKPGASTPPPQLVDGIPVQPMNPDYGYNAGLHAHPVNSVPWSAGSLQLLRRLSNFTPCEWSYLHSDHFVDRVRLVLLLLLPLQDTTAIPAARGSLRRLLSPFFAANPVP
ncbi:hypothetical protein NL676_037987 [Syzygium grande]|nr:hypothetical protein NL676_037987 [Syzygium grande]